MTSLEVIISVRDNQQEEGKTRIAAAKLILDYATKGIEIDDLAKRIEAIEQAQVERKPYGLK
jgi:hypothetical protein